MVERIPDERFVLASTCIFSHAALRFAVEYPERLAGLILFTTAVSGWPLEHLAAVADENWDLFLWSRLPPGLPQDQAQARVEELEGLMTQQDLLRRWLVGVCSDASEIVGRVTTPTLVIHPRDFYHLNYAEGARTAAAIPNARLALVDGDDPGDLIGNADDVLAAIDSYCAGLTASPPGTTRGTVVRLGLSTRQEEVLQLMMQGKTNREIAEELVLSQRTVERHLADLYDKLGVRNRTEATALAFGALTAK